MRVVEAPDAADVIGINDRVALAAAEERMRRRIAEEHMRNGVTIVDPATTRIDAGVEIGQDARIEPWTILEGATVIAQDAVIGPNAHVRDSRIGPRTRVWASVVEESTVAEDVEIGPFAHLRPGSEIGARCRIGNFAEIKKSRLGAGTQQHHFSYLGDAEIGEDVNVGAGSVTANFDGTAKHRTVIGDRASIGVDTMMVAPVTIGEGATTGAGSVVTRDVAPGKKVVGVPARPIEMKRRTPIAGGAGRAQRRRGARPDRGGSEPVGRRNQPGPCLKAAVPPATRSIDLLVVVTLILVGGFFAASEIALITVKRHRLSQLADDGNSAARTAQRLVEDPEPLPRHDPDRDHLPRLPGRRHRRGRLLAAPRRADRRHPLDARSSNAAGIDRLRDRDARHRARSRSSSASWCRRRWR